MFIGVFKLMTPDTLKIMILAPPVSQASLKEPLPLSFKFVTTRTFPPLPPAVYMPPPSAPGKAGILFLIKSSGFAAHGL